MGRKALDLGEVGNITVLPQVQKDGRWVAAAGRKAQRYRARAYYRGHDGIRREVAVTGSSRARAQAAAEERLSTVLTASSDVTMEPGTLFVAAGEAWLKEIRRTDSGLSPRTISDYEETFRRCIDTPGSSLRGLSLTQANNPQRLRAFLQRVADERGTGTAKMCRSVLSGVFGLAVDNGVLDFSAISQVRSVKSQVMRVTERDNARAFTREERDAIVAYADDLANADEPLDPRTRRKRKATADLIAFMAGTGARIDEVRSLHWDAVNLETGACEIRGTKSRTSNRVVNLPASLLERMKRCSEASGGVGLVFPSPAHMDEPEKPWDQSNSAQAVRKVLDEAGFRWAVPHTFRRTVATLLGDQGVPIRRIADQLGHADPAMTLRVYLGRDLEGDKADLAALL